MNNSSAPCKVTIGITCYNAQDTIARAIQSALAQDWPMLQIVVVDDCSTDQSIEIVQALCKAHENIQLICHEDNTGPAGARNTILKHAEGTFVAFFDDDDESHPSRITCQIETILACEKKHDTNLVACYASGARRYENGYELELPAIGSQGPTIQGPSIANYLLFFDKNPEWFYGSGTPTCSLMARKSSFEAVGNFDSSLRRVEDADLAIRWALAGAYFVGTNEKLFLQHASVAADKSPKKNHDAEKMLAHKNEGYLKSIGYYYYALNWPTLRYAHFTRNYLLLFTTLIKLFLHYPIKVPRHFIHTASRRFLHERKMKKKNK